MSAQPVDVLAVIGQLAFDTPAENAGQASDALAAVRELIEAAETLLDPHTPVGVDAQFERLRAALARCEGGAA